MVLYTGVACLRTSTSVSTGLHYMSWSVSSTFTTVCSSSRVEVLEQTHNCVEIRAENLFTPRLFPDLLASIGTTPITSSLVSCWFG